MPKVNPYGSPTDFTEGEKITKKSFTDLADNIRGLDGTIDDKNIRQEGLDGRNFSGLDSSGNVFIKPISNYQERTTSPTFLRCENTGISGSKDWRKVPKSSVFMGMSSFSDPKNVRIDFDFKPEFQTHAIIRCSGTISTRRERKKESYGTATYSGFYNPGSYTIDVGLLIREIDPERGETTDDSSRFDLGFNRNQVEKAATGIDGRVWPYQRVCLNEAYGDFSIEGVRKNVTDWRGYKLDAAGRIEPPETSSEGAMSGLIIPEQGHATEWLYDRQSYIYYNFNLIAHMSSEVNSGMSFLLNDSYVSSVVTSSRPDPLSSKKIRAELVYRTNKDGDEIKNKIKDYFERDAAPTIKHLDPLLSTRSETDIFKITNLTMNVQVLNR